MPSYQKDDVKAAASGRWAEIINQLTGIPDDYLTTQHRDCPKCGGTDRWRVFDDFPQTGGAVCNQCGSFSDGLEFIRWANGSSFPGAVARVAEYLRIPAARRKGGKAWKPSQAAIVPSREKQERRDNQLSKIERTKWNPVKVTLFCRRKGPLTPSGLQRSGATCATYRLGKKQFQVIVVPTKSGYVAYNLAGDYLPGPKNKNNGQYERLKVKVIGNGFGLAADQDEPKVTA